MSKVDIDQEIDEEAEITESIIPDEISQPISTKTETIQQEPPKKIEVKPSDFFFGDTLGEGAFARVVHARLKSTENRDFAVKIMEKAHIQRENKVKQVKMEVQILSRLSHPFVIKFEFSFQDSDYLYVCMELAPGRELLSLIKSKLTENQEKGIEGVACDESLTQFYIAEVVEALAHMHGLGIIHRDLKPENVLLTESGHIKVTDFGTALSDTDPTATRKSFVGTAEYVSPEVLRDEEVTGAADLWALGCMSYQMLTGTTPFRSPTEYLTMERIRAYLSGASGPLSYPGEILTPPTPTPSPIESSDLSSTSSSSSFPATSLVSSSTRQFIYLLLRDEASDRLGAPSLPSSPSLPPSTAPSPSLSLETQLNDLSLHPPPTSPPSPSSSPSLNIPSDSPFAPSSSSSHSGPRPRPTKEQILEGMEALKAHSFFAGITWGVENFLREPGPFRPSLSSYPRPEKLKDGADTGWLLEGEATLISSDSLCGGFGEEGEDDEEDEDISRMLRNKQQNQHGSSSSSSLSPSKSSSSASSAHHNQNEAIRKAYSKLLSPNENHVFSGTIVKRKGLFSKERILILTDRPRLFYLDPQSFEMKGSIPWTDDQPISCSIIDHQRFDVHSSKTGRKYHLSSREPGSEEWVSLINDLLSSQTKVKKHNSGRIISTTSSSISSSTPSYDSD